MGFRRCSVVLVALLAASLAASTGAAAFADEPVQPQATAGEAAVQGRVLSIAAPDDLRAFARSVAEGDDYAGATVVLAADLDMQAESWEPIGPQPQDENGVYAGAFFAGTFDGGGHRVLNLSYREAPGDAERHRGSLALFAGLAATGVVKDLGIKGALEGTNTVAGVVGINHGRVEGCSFSGSLSADEAFSLLYPQAGTSGCGGIVGINYGTVSGCSTAEGTAVVRGGSVGGGIVGANHSGLVEGCVNRATVSDRTSPYQVLSSAAGAIAGIVGMDDRATPGPAAPADAAVRDCRNLGAVTADRTAGGIVGLGNLSVVADCYNAGAVTVTADWAGGIVGWLSQFDDASEVSVAACTNDGAVSGAANVGGIVGWAQFGYGSTNAVRIENCLNRANVGGASSVGGIAGQLDGEMRACFNTGGVAVAGRTDDDTYGGGVAGSAPGIIADCGNAGTVRFTLPADQLSARGAVYLGGVAGSCGLTGRVGTSYNIGRVLVDADVEYVAHRIYPGGVVGAASAPRVTCSYYSAELAGDATALDPYSTWSRQGTPTRDMLGLRAAEGMPGLFASGGSAWTTSGPVTSDGRVYVTTPYLPSAGAEGFRMDETTAALIDVSYFTVTLPDGEGYAVVPAEDQRTDAVLAGGDFFFTVEVAEGYVAESLRVKANGVELRPSANGLYAIRDIRENQTVVVEGVTKIAPAKPSAPSGKRLAATGDPLAPVGTGIVLIALAACACAAKARGPRACE